MRQLLGHRKIGRSDRPQLKAGSTIRVVRTIPPRCRYSIWVTFDGGLYPLELDKDADSFLSRDVFHFENDDLIDVPVLVVALVLYLWLEFRVDLTRADHVLVRNTDFSEPDN